MLTVEHRLPQLNLLVQCIVQESGWRIWEVSSKRGGNDQAMIGKHLFFALS